MDSSSDIHQDPKPPDNNPHSSSASVDPSPHSAPVDPPPSAPVGRDPPTTPPNTHPRPPVPQFKARPRRREAAEIYHDVPRHILPDPTRFLELYANDTPPPAPAPQSAVPNMHARRLAREGIDTPRTAEQERSDHFDKKLPDVQAASRRMQNRMAVMDAEPWPLPGPPLREENADTKGGESEMKDGNDDAGAGDPAGQPHDSEMKDTEHEGDASKVDKGKGREETVDDSEVRVSVFLPVLTLFHAAANASRTRCRHCFFLTR